MVQAEWTSQPIKTGRRGRFGKTAETRGKVYLPVWWDPLVLGKILIAVGILRARGKYRAGLSDGVALVLRSGWHRLTRDFTDDELAEAFRRLGPAYPGLAEVYAYWDKARKTIRPTVYVRE